MDQEIEDIAVEEEVVDAKPETPHLPIPDGNGGVKDDVEDKAEEPAGKTGEADKSGELAPDLAAWAKDLGFDDGDLEGQTPEQVERMCKATEKRIKALPGAGAAQSETGGGVTPPQKSETEKADGSPKASKLEFPKEVREKFDPEVMGLLDQLNNHYGTQVEQLMGKLQAREAADSEREAVQQTQRLASEVDTVLTKMGKEYESIFGSAPVTDLKDGSQELTNREKVYQEVVLMLGAYHQAGRPVSSVKVLVERTARGLFAESATKAAKNNLRNAIRDRQGRIVSVPTERGIPERRPATPKQRDQKTLAMIDSKLKALGAGDEL